jgi:hypothetical protein
VDAHDTSNCQVGHRCESCGRATDDLAGKTYRILGVVISLTVCRPCRESDLPPSIQVGMAERLAAQHRDHVRGVTPVYRQRRTE